VHFIFYRNPLTMAEFPYGKNLIGGGLYIVGAYIFSNRLPESFFPGKFDFCGNSHNLWHMFVLLATITYFYGSLEVYHLRRHYQCPA
jgi:adiponectin receptor